MRRSRAVARNGVAAGLVGEVTAFAEGAALEARRDARHGASDRAQRLVAPELRVGIAGIRFGDADLGLRLRDVGLGRDLLRLGLGQVPTAAAWFACIWASLVCWSESL